MQEATSRSPGASRQVPERLRPISGSGRAHELAISRLPRRRTSFKLPNISASMPQLRPRSPSCSRRVSRCGLPTIPRATRSATLPPLRRRQGAPSTRCCAKVTPTACPASVKAYARRHPTSMGDWSPTPLAVATMTAGDSARPSARSRSIIRQRAHRARRSAARSQSSRAHDVLAGEISTPRDASRALDQFLASSLLTRATGRPLLRHSRRR